MRWVTRIKIRFLPTHSVHHEYSMARGWENLLDDWSAALKKVIL